SFSRPTPGPDDDPFELTAIANSTVSFMIKNCHEIFDDRFVYPEVVIPASTIYDVPEIPEVEESEESEPEIVVTQVPIKQDTPPENSPPIPRAPPKKTIPIPTA